MLKVSLCIIIVLSERQRHHRFPQSDLRHGRSDRSFSLPQYPDCLSPLFSLYFFCCDNACHIFRDMLYCFAERCQSGRMCRSRKAVRCKPSWVRIPLSPLTHLEESHSGLVSTTGNRVRCKPSWVQIPPPPYIP